jgi:hypothetical protein
LISIVLNFTKFIIKKTDNQWNDLIDLLPKDDVCYVIADVHFKTNDVPKTDIVFITWAPDTTSIKRRMIIASR